MGELGRYMQGMNSPKFEALDAVLERNKTQPEGPGLRDFPQLREFFFFSATVLPLGPSG